jgi:hypothetical protein
MPADNNGLTGLIPDNFHLTVAFDTESVTGLAAKLFVALSLAFIVLAVARVILSRFST